MYYGQQLMEPPQQTEVSSSYKTKFAVKTLLAPMLAASIESKVSNRAEVQRFFGPEKFAKIEARMARGAISRAAGPAFMSNFMRNCVICQPCSIMDLV